MYPHLFGLEGSSWIFFVSLGVIAALMLFRVFSYVFKLSDRAFMLYGTLVLVSIFAGFLFAFLFQSFYNWIETGKFKLQGVTFMGGLVGAMAVFFIGSLIFAKRELKKEIWTMVSLAPISVAAAHSLGRIGCLLAGCCYGVETHGWGIHFPDDFLDVLRFPTQLFEALFLAVLCGVLILLVLKFKKYSLTAIVYLFSYSVFRFIIEFWRGDDRGGAGFLSPSQWQSVFMFALAVFLTVYIFAFKRIPFNQKQEGRLSEFLYSPAAVKNPVPSVKTNKEGKI